MPDQTDSQFPDKPYHQTIVLLGIVTVWALLHWIFRDTLIFHDSWHHNFPTVYEIAQNSACGQFAHWLSSDTGSPTSIYSLSFSLTNPIRILMMQWWGCYLPTPFDAMAFYKLQIFAIYLGFSMGMYVLGRVLFRHWVSAIYLLAAALFAGLCMAGTHSDEAITTVFWVPWCVAALGMANRHAGTSRALLYWNISGLFFCLQLLDMYPHIPTLAAAYAIVIYGVIRPAALRAVVRRWHVLWPAVVLIGITAAGLYAIQLQIFDYQPSQRTQIKITPSVLGQTGFVQPSGFLGSLFPLTFTAAFEEIASGYGWRKFMFRLDVLYLYLGTVPIFLIISLFPGRGFRGPIVGWAAFTILMMLTALQTSGFYYVIFYLPFFDLFRSYFHFFDYAIIGFLVVSGFGFDRLMGVSAVERSKIIRSTLFLGGIFFAAGALLLGGVAYWGRGHGPGLPAYTTAMIGDSAILFTVVLLLVYAAQQSAAPLRMGGLIILALIIPQAVHTVNIYQMLGEPSQATFARYKISDTMLKPLTTDELATPSSIMREICLEKAGCNLARRPVASLRTDFGGSFFRHRLNPVFRKKMSSHVKTALVGVTHPILWASNRIESVSTYDELASRLEQNRDDLQALLAETTYVVGTVEGKIMSDGPANTEFSDLSYAPNRISFSYATDKPAFANLSTSVAPDWTVKVSGVPTTPTKGLFDIFTIPIPRGSGEVTLQYDSNWSRFLFWSRWILAAIGVLCALTMALTTPRQAKPAAGPGKAIGR